MKHVINIGLSIFLLSGCGAEIAYKRGASARDLQLSKAACQKASDEKALEKCLEDNGWMVHKLNDSGFSDEALFATASVTEDNRTTKPKAKEDAIETTENLKAENIVTESDANKETSETKSVEAHIKPIQTKKSTNTPSKPPTKQKSKPSLFDTYVIKSWWKMGGTPKLLAYNMDECSASLGEAHQPNKKTFTFTRAFAICLRDKGWRGLIDRK